MQMALAGEYRAVPPPAQRSPGYWFADQATGNSGIRPCTQHSNASCQVSLFHHKVAAMIDQFTGGAYLYVSRHGVLLCDTRCRLQPGRVQYCQCDESWW